MKKREEKNYLENTPERASDLKWKVEDNVVVLEIENKGVFNTIAQKLFKKPRVSFIHLDPMGSFIWQSIDGTKNLILLADELKAEFGDDAEPLYERLSNYIRILDSYGFITLK
jgi:hypothetical protein